MGHPIPAAEVRERRTLPVAAALDVRSHHEHAARGAVIGSVGGVRVARAAELGERHHRDAPCPSGVEHIEESTDGGVELLHPGGMHARLVGMAVEVTPRGLEDAEAQIGVDESGCGVELADQRSRWYVAREDRLEPGSEVDLVSQRPRDRVMPRSLPGRAGERPHCAVEPHVGIRRAPSELRCTDRNGRGPAVLADHVQRNTGTDRRCRVEVGTTSEVPVEPASEPARRGRAGDGPRAHPVRHRVEVAEVGVGIADTVDDGELTRVPQTLGPNEGRVESDLVIEGQRRRPRESQRSVLSDVRAVVERHHRVEPVVAAVHPDHHHDPVVRADRRRKRRCREPRHRGTERIEECASAEAGTHAHRDELQKRAP
jgi:hypothetical protein